MAALCAILSGCRTAEISSQESADASSFWEPQLLIISGERYPKLHVEIDAVEGTAPNEAEIASLKAFLTERCRKPGGISIGLDDTISRSSAEGKLSRVLALEHMDGPPDSESAYLYYLFFDSEITPEPKSRPVCLLTPFHGAIMMDHQYLKTRSRRLADFRRRILLHETAHALGSCRNSDHSDGLHCTSENCLMNHTLYISVSRYILGRDPIRQKEFCEHCQADFQANLKGAPPTNLRYHGAYLVRSEPKYQVISRPNLVYVQIGPYDSISWDEVENLRKEAATGLDSETGIYYAANAVDEESAQAAVDALMKDPVKTVRDIGDKYAKQLPVE